jgi:hypothetical protein
MNGGIHQHPNPSCPVASTSFRQYSVEVTPPSSTVTASNPGSVRATPRIATPLRTGTPVTSRTHNR